MRTKEAQTKKVPMIPYISDILVNSSFLMSSDFSRRAVVHKGICFLSVFSRKKIDSTVQELEYNEIKAYIVVPNIMWCLAHSGLSLTMY